jgi:CPA1 family monovalent cation:H+ antiporter
MSTEIVFVTLFSVATAVALLTRWVKMPYTVALVVAGLLLGSTRVFQPPHLTKELLYAVILPGLLFEASFHLEARRFWQNKLVILSLAAPGVLIATGLTALMLVPAANALHFIDGFKLGHGLVFGALIAATDPIAVVALFRSLGAPKRLSILVEGESLLNDGTSVVIFSLLLSLVWGGAHSSLGQSVLAFFKVVGLGLFIGVSFGFAASKVIQRVDDAMIEITCTTIAAYGSFVAAEEFHASGVIATVTAGMLCGNYGARTGMSPTTRVAVESFWEYVAFALNSIVFLLIGFQVHIDQLLASWKAIFAAYLAVTLGRAIVIFAVTALLRRTREKLPWRWSAIMTWGGLRGGLSMVLALGLPLDFPYRELIITMTFGVVLLSILVQGLTMRPLLKRFGLVSERDDQVGYEISRGELAAAAAALEALEAMARERTAHPEVLDELRAAYAARREKAEAAVRAVKLDAPLRAEELRSAERQLLLVEKDQLRQAHHQGVLGQAAFEKLMQDVDARLYQLENEEANGGRPEGAAEKTP